MIKITNTRNVVNVVETGEGHQAIILNQDYTIQPKEQFCFETGLLIECDHEFDEVWVYSDKQLGNEGGEMLEGVEILGILTYRITKEDGQYPLDLIGGYMGNHPITLPKGTEISRIYTSLRNPNKLDAKELSYKSMFNDRGIIVKTAPDYLGNFELIIEPEGQTYIKIHLP